MTKKPVKKTGRKPAGKPAAAVHVKLADQIVNQTELAEALGLTTRRLRQLEKEEQVIVSEGHGKFRVGSVLQAYAAYLKEGTSKKLGNTSADDLRQEKIMDAQMARAIKQKELIPLDASLDAMKELVGMFVTYLSGLPAELTGVPKDRQRFYDIIDIGKQRLADRCGKRIEALASGSALTDAETGD